MVDNILNRINKIVPQKWQWILNHEGFRKYFKNTGWMFGGQFLYLLLSFFIGAWMARYLGPEKYGTVSYILAFVGLFSFVASMGIDGILKRELVKYPEKHNVLMGSAFRLKIIGALLAIVAVIISILFISGNSYLSKLLIILFSLNFLVQVPFLLNNHFYSQVKAKNAVKSHFFATLISSIFKIILILSGQGIIWLILIYVSDSLWHVLFLVYYYKKDKQNFLNWKYDKKITKNILKESWPLMLSSAAVTIYYRIDQVMVGKMMGDYDLGIYSVAVKLAEVFNFIPGIIIGSLFPAIVNAKKTSEEFFKSRQNKLYFLLVLIAFIISITITIFAKSIINIVYGINYSLSVSVLQIYIWSSIGLFLSHAIFNKFMIDNKSKKIFKLNLFSMLLNIGLNILMIPKFGLRGAALATLISYSLIPLYLVLFKKINK